MSRDQPLLENVNVLCGPVTHGCVLAWTWSALPVTHGRIGSCSSHRIWARVPSPPAPAALRARDPLADARCTRHFSNLLHVVKQAFSAASPCMRMYIYSEGQPDQASRSPMLLRTDGIIWNPGHRGEALSPAHALPLQSRGLGCFCTPLTAAAPTPSLPPTHALSLGSGYGVAPASLGRVPP